MWKYKNVYNTLLCYTGNNKTIYHIIFKLNVEYQKTQWICNMAVPAVKESVTEGHSLTKFRMQVSGNSLPTTTLYPL